MRNTIFQLWGRSVACSIPIAGLVALGLGLGCSSPSGTTGLPEPTGRVTPPSTSNDSNPVSAGALKSSSAAVTDPMGAKARALGARRASWNAVDPALRAKFVRARMDEAGSEYNVDNSAGTVRARNNAKGMDIRYDKDRVTMTVDRTGSGNAGESGALTIAFRGIGRGSQRETPRVESVQSSGTRVDYLRAGVVESYTNGPLGIEQIFAISHPPSGSGHVEIGVGVQGLTPTLAADGTSIGLLDPSKKTIFDVGELVVTDANDHVLRSSFAVKNGELVIDYDDANAVYPVRVDPLFANFVGAFIPSDPTIGSAFGFAASIDGSTAVVGAPLQSNGRGEAYVFTKSSAGVWSEAQQLKWTDGIVGILPLDPPDEYGYAVAVSGNVIAVGAPVNDNDQEGEVHVYERSGSSFVWKATLLGNDHVSDAADWFGFSLALADNTLVIGAPQGDIGGPSGPQHGSVYIATRGSGSWSPVRPLSYSGPIPGDFGFSVALMGGTLIVGSPGTSANDTFPNDGKGVGFGVGAAWIFQSTEAGFVQQASLRSPSSTIFGNFGASVALSDVTSSTVGTALIGEPGAFIAGHSAAGRANVFTRSGSSWSSTAQLVPATAGNNTQYGDSVVLSTANIAGSTKTVAVVGAPASDSATAIFLRSGSTWSEQTAIAGASGTATSRGLAISGDTVVLGSPGFPVGIVAFATISASNGDACTQPSDCGSGFCVDGVCCNTACSGGTTDCQACNVTGAKGTCTPLPSTTVCRAANPANLCDAPEMCNGSSAACPSDKVKPAGTVCRAASTTNLCDAQETCNGTSAACPADGVKPAGTVCRAASTTNLCDAPETCNGTSAACPADGVKPAGTECRPVNGQCDVAETCNGTSAACPLDGYQPTTTLCGSFLICFCPGNGPACGC